MFPIHLFFLQNRTQSRSSPKQTRNKQQRKKTSQRRDQNQSFRHPENVKTLTSALLSFKPSPNQRTHPFEPLWLYRPNPELGYEFQTNPTKTTTAPIPTPRGTQSDKFILLELEEGALLGLVLGFAEDLGFDFGFGLDPELDFLEGLMEGEGEEDECTEELELITNPICLNLRHDHQENNSRDISLSLQA